MFGIVLALDRWERHMLVLPIHAHVAMVSSLDNAILVAEVALPCQ